MSTAEEDRQIAQIVDRLRSRHPHVHPDTVAEITRSVRRHFDGRPIRDYVPLFVERRADAALTDLADTR